ncbi:MAG TPA: hypothetical protein VI215_03715 [Bacteroidota bacterium]|jgi:hypothetical protein
MPLKSFPKTPFARKVAWYAGIAVAGVALVCMSIFLFVPDAYLDGFVARRIIRAFDEAYPDYTLAIGKLHYSLLNNRLECDSVLIGKRDSTISCSVGRFFVAGITRRQLLWGGGVAPDNLVSSTAGVERILMIFPMSGYKLSCDRIRVSVPDSVVVLEKLEYRPLGSDEEFFASSKTRRTRYRLLLPRCNVMGSACLRLLEGEVRCTRTAYIESGSLDVLINRDRPAETEIASPPNEILSSIRKTFQVDSLHLANGHLKYGERYQPGSKPAILTLEDTQLTLAWIEGKGGQDTATLQADGRLMNAGRLDVSISMPIASPGFSFHYSGRLGKMELSDFNPFIEISEQKRLKTGILHGSTFDIDSEAGRARGTVTAIYKDLKIAAISDRTGDEGGVGNKIVSFIGNNIKLRTTNLPDESGSMKIGRVKYERKKDEAFLAFAWYALRTGLSDIVGF